MLEIILQYIKRISLYRKNWSIVNGCLVFASEVCLYEIILTPDAISITADALELANKVKRIEQGYQEALQKLNQNDSLKAVSLNYDFENHFYKMPDGTIEQHIYRDTLAA